MSQVQLTQVQWAGKNLRRVGTVTVDTADILARVDMGEYSVLYLRSGEKVFVKEQVGEIERLAVLSQAQRETIKRFKRDLRECKAIGISVDQAFAGLWEEIATRSEWSEAEQARLYQELLEWTKRWLK